MDSGFILQELIHKQYGEKVDLFAKIAISKKVDCKGQIILMKKVLFILNYMNIGGTEKAFLNLVDTLPPEEYDVTLLLLEKKGGFLDQVPERVHVITLDNYFPDIKSEIMDPPMKVCRSYMRKGRLLSAAGLFISHLIYKITGNRTAFYRYTLRGIWKFEGFDEYHAYAGPFDFISALVAYRCYGGKKIQWIHFDILKFFFDRRTCESLYLSFDEIRVVSYEALDHFVKCVPKLKDKTTAFPNIVSFERCRDLAEKGEGFIDEFDGIRIVTLGRLSEEKGQDIIPEIASVLKSDGYHFRWYLIGDGYLRETIEKRAEKFGCEKEIRFLGTKSNPYPYLKDADIYVQTSVHEGFCLSLSEAKAFNLAIISTDFAGAHEQLNGYPGGYIAVRDQITMSKTIEMVINSLESQNEKNG